MPVGGFSVGRDVSLNIFSRGALLSLGLITDFDAKPQTSEVKILGLDGIMRTLILHEGWVGSFTITRQDSSLDDYWALSEEDYYTGANVPFGMINETITNPSGLTSQYRFTQVALRLEDAGVWSGNKSVTQKLGFAASRRKIA